MGARRVRRSVAWVVALMLGAPMLGAPTLGACDYESARQGRPSGERGARSGGRDLGSGVGHDVLGGPDSPLGPRETAFREPVQTRGEPAQGEPPQSEPAQNERAPSDDGSGGFG